MSIRIALEIAAELDVENGILFRQAAAVIRAQHAEIERLTAERDTAIAEAVAAEREAISAQLLELADELGYGSSWWGPPGGLLLRAADMVSARAKQ